jgi:uncharacterized protein (DUF3820 family)
VKYGKKVEGGDNNASRMYLFNKQHVKQFHIKDKLHISYITSEVNGKMSNKKPSYTDRLLKALEALDNYDEIKKLVNDFRAEEAKLYDEEKEKTPKDIIPFGKYKGKTVSEIAQFDRKYLEWVVKQEWFDKFTDLKKLVIASM